MDNSINFCEFANAPSKFDTCLQGNLQVEILKSLETRQLRYNFSGICDWPRLLEFDVMFY